MAHVSGDDEAASPTFKDFVEPFEAAWSYVQAALDFLKRHVSELDALDGEHAEVDEGLLCDPELVRLGDRIAVGEVKVLECKLIASVEEWAQYESNTAADPETHRQGQDAHD